MAIKILPVAETQAELIDAAVALGDRYTETLGLLTPPAYRKHASDGGLLVAVDEGEVVGYALFGLPKRSPHVSLAHLCIAKGHRGKGAARLLVEEIRRRHSDRLGIKAKCRRDYGPTARRRAARHHRRPLRHRPHHGFGGVGTHRCGQGRLPEGGVVCSPLPNGHQPSGVRRVHERCHPGQRTDSRRAADLRGASAAQRSACRWDLPPAAELPVPQGRSAEAGSRSLAVPRVRSSAKFWETPYPRSRELSRADDSSARRTPPALSESAPGLSQFLTHAGGARRSMARAQLQAVQHCLSAAMPGLFRGCIVAGHPAARDAGHAERVARFGRMADQVAVEGVAGANSARQSVRYGT